MGGTWTLLPTPPIEQYGAPGRTLTRLLSDGRVGMWPSSTAGALGTIMEPDDYGDWAHPRFRSVAAIPHTGVAGQFRLLSDGNPVLFSCEHYDAAGKLQVYYRDLDEWEDVTVNLDTYYEAHVGGYIIDPLGRPIGLTRDPRLAVDTNCHEFSAKSADYRNPDPYVPLVDPPGGFSHQETPMWLSPNDEIVTVSVMPLGMADYRPGVLRVKSYPAYSAGGYTDGSEPLGLAGYYVGPGTPTEGAFRWIMKARTPVWVHDAWGTGYETGPMLWHPGIQRAVFIGGFGTIYKYDPVGDTWEASCDLPTRRPAPNTGFWIGSSMTIDEARTFGLTIFSLGDPLWPRNYYGHLTVLLDNDVEVRLETMPVLLEDPGYWSFIDHYINGVPVWQTKYALRGVIAGDLPHSHPATYSDADLLAMEMHTGDPVARALMFDNGADTAGVLLPNGKFLFMAEWNDPYAVMFGTGALIWEWDPDTDTIEHIQPPYVDLTGQHPEGPRYFGQDGAVSNWLKCNMTLLPSGQVFMSIYPSVWRIAGDSNAAQGYWLYTPDDPGPYDEAWRPSIVGVIESDGSGDSREGVIVPGTTIRVRASQATGVFEGGSQGEDDAFDTNIPCPTLTAVTTGEVLLCRAVNLSYRGIMPGRVSDFDVQVPSHVPFGDYDLRITTNGIASAAVRVKIGDPTHASGGGAPTVVAKRVGRGDVVVHGGGSPVATETVVGPPFVHGGGAPIAPDPYRFGAGKFGLARGTFARLGGPAAVRRVADVNVQGGGALGRLTPRTALTTADVQGGGALAVTAEHPVSDALVLVDTVAAVAHQPLAGAGSVIGHVALRVADS